MVRYPVIEEKENLVVEVSGTQGPEGAQGPIGNTGPEGVQGPIGNTGLPGLGVHTGALPPSNPYEGILWYNETLDELNVYRNTSWEPIPLKNELDGSFGAVTVNAGYF